MSISLSAVSSPNKLVQHAEKTTIFDLLNDHFSGFQTILMFNLTSSLRTAFPYPVSMMTLHISKANFPTWFWTPQYAIDAVQHIWDTCAHTHTAGKQKCCRPLKSITTGRLSSKSNWKCCREINRTCIQAQTAGFDTDQCDLHAPGTLITPRSALLGNRTVHRKRVLKPHHFCGSYQKTAQCLFSYNIPSKFVIFPPNLPFSGLSKLRSRSSSLLSDKRCGCCLAKMGNQIPEPQICTWLQLLNPSPFFSCLSSCPFSHFIPIPHNNLQFKILAC